MVRLVAGLDRVTAVDLETDTEAATRGFGSKVEGGLHGKTICSCTDADSALGSELSVGLGEQVNGVNAIVDAGQARCIPLLGTGTIPWLEICAEDTESLVDRLGVEQGGCIPLLGTGIIPCRVPWLGICVGLDDALVDEPTSWVPYEDTGRG